MSAFNVRHKTRLKGARDLHCSPDQHHFYCSPRSCYHHIVGCLRHPSVLQPCHFVLSGGQSNRAIEANTANLPTHPHSHSVFQPALSSPRWRPTALYSLAMTAATHRKLGGSRICSYQAGPAHDGGPKREWAENGHIAGPHKRVAAVEIYRF